MASHLKILRESNPILECCASLIALTMKFKDSTRGVDVSSKFRTMIFVAFDEFERKAYERKLSLSIINESKFALSAFIDETVLTSLWEGRMQWMSNPLQLKYFGEHLGGEEFYTKLQAFRQSGEQNRHLIELYYVCLQLGFQGKYRIKGFEKLMALQVDIENQIYSYKVNNEKRLSPSGMPNRNIISTIRKEVPYWVIICVSVSMILFTYITFSKLISDHSTKTLIDIGIINKKMSPHFTPGITLLSNDRDGLI